MELIRNDDGTFDLIGMNNVDDVVILLSPAFLAVDMHIDDGNMVRRMELVESLRRQMGME